MINTPMRRRENTQFRTVKKRRGRRILASVMALALVFYLAGTYLAMPTQALAGSSNFETSLVSNNPVTPPNLAWPNYGQAALGTKAYGLLATHGKVKTAPIASIGKLMTALAVLEKRPLAVGEQGPTITITQADQEKYDWYYVRDGSLAAIKVGEKISQYKALEALLLPSANNYAYTLARWAFGSVENYTKFANNYAEQLGLNDSYFADASGFSSQTVSSATDLIKLGQLVLKNPVLAEIVQKQSATIPVAGKVHNSNLLLRRDSSVVGLKTGNTEQAGDCLLFAATHEVDGQEVTVIGAIMGAPDRPHLFNDSLKLLNSAKQNFETKTIINRGEVVGRYELPWGGSVDAVASASLSNVVWRGHQVVPEVSLKELSFPAKAGRVVGSINAQSITFTGSQSIKVELADAVEPPSWRWRLTHPAKTWQLAF